MPYDWRQEQEEANRRRAREEEIAAQQEAHNQRLEENARKAGQFWEEKMEADRKRAAEEREKNSSGCSATVLLGLTLGALFVSVLRAIAS